MTRKPELAGEAFNLSTEIQVSVLELVERVLKVMDSPLTPIVLGEASHEIKHQYLDAGKARKTLGWQPLFTLDEGLTRTVQWYRNYIQSISKRNHSFSAARAAAAA